jgi:hypothetical protein
VAEEVEEAEKLLSRQRMQRLRESLAFRSLEPCSSCVLEVPEGVLGVHGGVLGVLGSAADLVLLQQRSRGKKVEKLGVGLWRRKVPMDWWMGWSGCGCEMIWWE